MPSKAIYREKRSKAIADIKNVPCMDCNVRYEHYQMHFDHRDPSTKRFGISGNRERSWLSITKEMVKCDVVCANCHAKRTWDRLQTNKQAE